MLLGLARHGLLRPRRPQLLRRPVVDGLRLDVDAHAVPSPRRLWADHLVEDVVEHPLRVTLQRVAVSAAAWADGADDVAGFRPLRLELGRQVLLLAVADEHHVARRSVVAAEATLWRVPVAVALQAHVGAAEELHVADRPVAAAPFAGAALVGAQLVPADAQGIVRLD